MNIEPDGMPMDNPQIQAIIESQRRDPFSGMASRELSEELDRRMRNATKALSNENERLVANIMKLHGRIDRLRFLVALMRVKLPDGAWDEDMQKYFENVPHSL